VIRWRRSVFHSRAGSGSNEMARMAICEALL